MSSPQERNRRCRCSKCTLIDPDGQEVTAKMFREHHKKRPLEDDLVWGDSSFLPAKEDVPTIQVHLPSNTSSGLWDTTSATRLEIQEIRYQALECLKSIGHPQQLVFASRQKIPLSGPAYSYQETLNQAPYDLTQSPINYLFLQTEHQLHECAQRLKRLRAIASALDANVQQRLASVEKEVISSLNKMYTWKVELYHVEASATPYGVCPIVDTTPYLLFYQESDPLYSRIVLSGLLLVVAVHLIFNGSQALCDVILAFLHDQVNILEGLIGEERRLFLSRSIPLSVKTALSTFNLDPVVRPFIVCPQCYDISPLKPADNDRACKHKPTLGSAACGSKTVRPQVVGGEDVGRPIKEYVHQGFKEWLARFLCRPEIEELLRRRKEEHRRRQEEEAGRGLGGPQLVSDILDSKAIQEFAWPDGKSFFDCSDDEYRLFFALTIDGFNPNSNREAKQTTTSTAIYLYCLNLPLEERYKPHNVYLAGVIPGPDKPSTSQINQYISLLVDEFLPFWHTGVRYSRTRYHVHGALGSAVIMPIVCDALGARQLCGYGSVTSRFFCTVCLLPLYDLENFDKPTWPPRDLRAHRHCAEAWRDAQTEEARVQQFEEHGIRYTPLLRLPYFDPIKFTIVDTMHNFFLGLLQRHCRAIWGMDMDIADGDGTLRSCKQAPTQPSVAKMQDARKALQSNDAAMLAKTGKHTLFYLCIELDLRRGGKKRDLIRELLRWRKIQGSSLPETWGIGELGEPDAPTSTVYSQPSLPLPAPNQLSTSFLPVVLPPEVPAERVESAESALDRGLKLDGIRNNVLHYMCMRRNLPLPIKPQKKDMIAVLTEWRGERPEVPRKRKHRMTVVLGRAVLSAMVIDMERIVLPRWVDPAPIRAGQKKQGKLSADQWRSLCSIHLIVTLVRLWGRDPVDSRYHQMLTNFLDLVTAVELGSSVVTSLEHTETYRTIFTRYLVNMKRLYKEAIVVPNHHLALHVPDNQEWWGPSPQARGFGWERNNHTLQQVNTNKRFGEIEKSYMYSFARTSNFLALLSLDRIRGIVGKMYQKIQRLINPDSRGTRLHDLLNITPSEEAEQPKPSRRNRFTLDVDLLQKLSGLLVSEGCSRGDFVLHPSAVLLPSVKHNGATYRPHYRSPGDSNVLLNSASPLGYQPALLEKVVSYRLVISGEVRQETFCIVRHLQALSDADVQKDWFRRFQIAGSLWSTTYDSDSALQIVRPSALTCHFACTHFDPAVTECGPTFHVLPLDRLRTQVEAAGEPVKDTAFDKPVGVAEDEEEDSDFDQSDDEMDVDMY